MRVTKSISFKITTLAKAENFLKKRPDLSLSKLVESSLERYIQKSIVEAVPVICNNCEAQYSSFMRTCPQCKSPDRREGKHE